MRALLEAMLALSNRSVCSKTSGTELSPSCHPIDRQASFVQQALPPLCACILHQGPSTALLPSTLQVNVPYFGFRLQEL